MKLVALAIVAALAAPAAGDSTRAPAPEKPAQERRKTIHLIVIAVGESLYLSSELVFGDELVATNCRWCNPPGFDRDIRNALKWHNTQLAGNLSNFAGYVAVPMSLLTMFTIATWGHPHQTTEMFDDLVPVLESLVIAQLATQSVKFGTGRQRPNIHFSNVVLPPSRENNVSFFSAHTSWTTSLSVSAGLVAHRRRYPLEPVIWAVGIGLSATTGYLRIAADKHYASDVLMGAAIGTASGLFVPYLAHTLPEHTVLAPTGNGVALTGTF